MRHMKAARTWTELSRPKQITASAIEWLTLCSGRWHLTLEHWDEVKSRPASPEAEHGSRVHALLETWMRGGQRGTIEFANDRERDDFNACVELLHEAIRCVIPDQWKAVVIERRLESANKKWSGRPDLVLAYNGNRYLLVDYKTGKMEVTPSPRNTQLQALAVLLHENYKVDKVTVAIIAPNAPDKLSLAEYNKQALVESAKWINFVVESALSPDAAFHAGEPQCRFCPVKSYCPELARYVLQPAEDAMLNRAEVKTKDDVKALASELSLDQAGMIWVRRNMMNWLYDAIEERIQRLSDDELAAIGLERVPGRLMRTVKDVRELYVRLKSRLGTDSSEFVALCSVPVGAIEDYLVKRGLTKADAKRYIDGELLEGICEVTQCKPSIRARKTNANEP